MRAPRLILVVLAGLALAVGGLVRARRNPPAQAASPVGEAGSSVRPAVARLPANGSIGRLTVGGHRIYDVKASYAVDVTRQTGGISVPIELAGAWQVTVVRADAGGMLARSVFVGLTTVGKRPEPVLAAALAQPHYLAFAADGRLAAAYFRAEQDDFARGVLQSLAATLQLRGVEGTATRWEAEETDASGRYLAGYQRHGAMVDKTKLEYLHSGRVPTARDLRSRSRYQLDHDWWPRTLDGEETVTFVDGGVTVSTRSQIALLRTATGLVAVGEVDLGDYQKEQVGQSSRHNDARSDRLLLAGATLDDLLAGLAGEGDDVRGATSARLEALLRLEPARAGDVAARLLAGTDRSTARLLVAALAGAGTPAAQRALVELLGAGTLAAKDRARIATAMAMIERPDPEVTAGLQAQLGSSDRALARSSANALGVAALRLRSLEDPRATAVVDDLLVRLAAAARPEDQIALLHALGNAGDARALGAVRPHLESADPSVRRAAIESLRSFADSTVDDMLSRAMIDDLDPAVRRGAVFASSGRSVGPMLPALGRALTDGDEDVRREVVQVLGQHRDQAAPAGLLARAASSDPAESVRTEAQRLLAGQ